MTELLTDIIDLHAQYAAGITDPATLYATLSPLVDDGTLAPDTANDILDYADALDNVNALLADEASLRAVGQANRAAREAVRVQVARFGTEATLAALCVVWLCGIMIVALAALMTR